MSVLYKSEQEIYLTGGILLSVKNISNQAYIYNPKFALA